MAWAWKQSFAGQTLGTGGTVTATPGSNLTAGSTLIAIVALSNSTSTTCTSVKDASSNAFVEIVTSGYTNGTETSMWALNTPAGDAGAKPVITATMSDTSDGYPKDMVVVEFTGIVTSATAAGFIDGTAKSLTGNSAAATGNSGYSSTASNELLVMGYGDDGGPLTWALTANGGTNDNNGGTANGKNSDSNCDCELAFKNSTGGAETDSWALSGTATGWGIVCAAFKLTGGPVPTSAEPVQLAPAYVPGGAPGLPAGTPFAPWPPWEGAALNPIPSVPGTGTLAGSGSAGSGAVISVTASLAGAGFISSASSGLILAAGTLAGAGSASSGAIISVTGTLAGSAFTGQPDSQAIIGVTAFPAGAGGTPGSVGFPETTDPYTLSYTSLYGGVEAGYAATPSAELIAPDVLPGLPGQQAFAPWPPWRGTLPGVKIEATAALAGTANASAVATLGAGIISVTATLAGTGSAAAVPTVSVTAGLHGTGFAIAIPVFPAATPAGAVHGAGFAGAVAVISVTASLAGAGNLAARFLTGVQSVTASMAGAGFASEQFYIVDISVSAGISVPVLLALASAGDGKAAGASKGDGLTALASAGDGLAARPSVAQR